MGSTSKHSSSKETRKRRQSPSRSPDREPREKKHRHRRRHYKDRKHEKVEKTKPEYESNDSDVVEVSSEEDVGQTSQRERRSRTPDAGKSSESLSIEDTNRLRAKLGLKPLQVDERMPMKTDGRKSKGDEAKYKDDWGEFYHKPAQNINEKTQREKIKGRLTELKEKKKIDNKLQKQKLLSQLDNPDEDDAAAWVKKNRKVVEQKKEAEKRAKMLEELDAQFGIGDVVESELREKRNKLYTDRNLKGLRVEHDTESFQEGKLLVLTLKDQPVLADDEDVLVNVNLLDDERYKKSNENKKRKILDGGYEDEEVDVLGNLKPKSLLGKYDEEIGGIKTDSFTIGQDNLIERRRAALQSVKEKLSGKIVESIGSSNLTLASDYYTEEEMTKFNKPKRRAKKLRSKKSLLTADDLEKMDATSTSDARTNDAALLPTSEIKLEEEIDEVFEAALNKARKMKTRRGRTLPSIPLDFVQSEPTDELDSGNIVLNATAEFCRTLGDIPTYGKSGNREDTENLLDFEKEDVADMELDNEEDTDMSGKWSAVDPNRKQEKVIPITTEVQILDEEPDVGSGVGAALKLAMSKGYLEKETKGRPSNTKLAHLQAQHYSIEDKNYGDDLERGNRRERYNGPTSDFKEKDGFKPNVKLEYIDDDGHVLNAKEAFRYLSHKFHGKGPGKNKVEKRLKKAQQEGLMKKMSSTDTPLGTLNMLQSKQKETQSPFVVLSGGKQNSANSTISKIRR